MAGTLYLVATPIGNLGDVSSRALETLRTVGFVACEDTRHTRGLLTHYAIGTPTISYHDHNARTRAPQLLDRLEAGESVALVSDAGTPAISDPGYRLISGAAERGIRVVPVPGPSAVVAALSASGLATDAFLFAGFLPPKQGARRARLADLAGERATLVFYEAPHRISETLADMLDAFGDREAVVARELTKLHEELARGRLSELAARFAGEVKGEVTVVVEGPGDVPAAAEPAAEELDDELRRRLDAGEKATEIARAVAKERGLVKAEVYARILELKAE